MSWIMSAWLALVVVALGVLLLTAPTAPLFNL